MGRKLLTHSVLHFTSKSLQEICHFVIDADSLSCPVAPCPRTAPGSNQDNMAPPKTRTNTMKAAIEELVSKLDDLEYWTHCSNLCLVGLSAKEDKPNMCALLEKWISEVLGEHNFRQPMLIESAHRIGSPSQRRLGIVHVCIPVW